MLSPKSAWCWFFGKSGPCDFEGFDCFFFNVDAGLLLLSSTKCGGDRAQSQNVYGQNCKFPKHLHTAGSFIHWSYGVTVSTLDSESSDRGSNPRRTLSTLSWRVPWTSSWAIALLFVFFLADEGIFCGRCPIRIFTNDPFSTCQLFPSMVHIDSLIRHGDPSMCGRIRISMIKRILF